MVDGGVAGFGISKLPLVVVSLAGAVPGWRWRACPLVPPKERHETRHDQSSLSW